MKKKNLGILGGMGPMATADLFRKIIALTDAERDRDHIRIFIDNHAQIPDRTDAILNGAENPLPYMSDSLRRLVGCGAECIVMPCNTAHYFLPALQAQTNVPFLSILTVSAGVCAKRFPGKTAAILATTGTIAAGLYQDALAKAGVSFLVPDAGLQASLMRVIYDGVKAGGAPDVYRKTLETVVSSLRMRGADFFLLGCTELPIAWAATGCAAPFLDPTTELAKAAIRYCGYRVRESGGLPG